MISAAGLNSVSHTHTVPGEDKLDVVMSTNDSQLSWPNDKSSGLTDLLSKVIASLLFMTLEI